MSDVVIRSEHLGKRYTLGSSSGQKTLRESIMGSLSMPVRAVRRTLQRSSAEVAPSTEFWALRDLSFEIHRGDIVGVVGSNGAGKSTLLKILSRIAMPTTGRVELRGRVCSLLEVGTGFHAELTGRENIFLNGAILGMRRAEIIRRFEEIVAFAEVDQFLDTPVKRYSSGMYVRLAFAVAAHLDPELLLVDEVLAVGDAQFQKKCLGKMAQVAKEGRTVLFVSHNMSAIMALCTQGIWLSHGTRRAQGPIHDVVESYARAVSGGVSADLSNVPNREGAGRIRIVRYWLESPRGSRVDHAISGQPVHIVLEYESKAHANRNCRVSLALDTMLGQHLFVCSTELTIVDEVQLSERGLAVCTIPAFPLTAGEYAMTLFVESNREVEDLIPSSARLSVTDGNFFGTGRQAPIGWEGKCVIVRHQWAIEPLEGSRES